MNFDMFLESDNIRKRSRVDHHEFRDYINNKPVPRVYRKTRLFLKEWMCLKWSSV